MYQEYTENVPVSSWRYVLIMKQYLPIGQSEMTLQHLPHRQTSSRLTRKIHFKMEVLIAFEERIFHNLPTDIFHLTNPEVQILISICCTLPQVEAFYVTSSTALAIR
jgi:hypothetical protein